MIVCLRRLRYQVTIAKSPRRDASTERVMLMDLAGQQHDEAATPVHPAALDPEVLARQCEFRATRRSGPGGQNRNKVETAVVLTHRPTGLTAQASERRTQGENRRAALERLRLELALTIRQPICPDAKRPYVPSAVAAPLPRRADRR